MATVQNFRGRPPQAHGLFQVTFMEVRVVVLCLSSEGADGAPYTVIFTVALSWPHASEVVARTEAVPALANLKLTEATPPLLAVA
jgi:hypothetical protein